MIVIMIATVGKQLSDSQRYGIIVWYLRLLMWSLV
jgi:hypothetical protein